MAITNEGDSQTFAYTGGMQSFTVPVKGVYKLEVWGAQGGAGSDSNSSGTPGNGGYSYGHALLEKGAVLYICCGQAGANSTATTYNGGGGAKSQYFNFTDHYKPTRIGCSGGGATHIATRSGTLAELGSTSGLLIVAGGGGGAAYGDGAKGNSQGGAGGGESGGAGTNASAWGASGGTQTSGYAFGQGQTAGSAWGNYDSYACAAAGGGGGGLYGGTAPNVSGNHESSARCGGGGGSGYIGGVPSLTYSGATYGCGMSNGQNSGSGYATITFVKKGELPVVFNGTKLEKIIFNGTEITSLIYNGTKLFIERMKERYCAWLSWTNRATCSKAST